MDSKVSKEVNKEDMENVRNTNIPNRNSKLHDGDTDQSNSCFSGMFDRFLTTRKRTLEKIKIRRKNRLRDLFLNEKETAIERFKIIYNIKIDPRTQIIEENNTINRTGLETHEIEKEQCIFPDNVFDVLQESMNSFEKMKNLLPKLINSQGRPKDPQTILVENAKSKLFIYSRKMEDILFLVDNPGLLLLYNHGINEIRKVLQQARSSALFKTGKWPVLFEDLKDYIPERVEMTVAESEERRNLVKEAMDLQREEILKAHFLLSEELKLFYENLISLNQKTSEEMRIELNDSVKWSEFTTITFLTSKNAYFLCPF